MFGKTFNRATRFTLLRSGTTRSDKKTLVFIILAFTVYALAFASFAQAQQGQPSARTYVKSDGRDADPCTLEQPCQTFAGALAKTEARGEIIALDSGEYGAVLINKSVSIIAPYGVHAEIAPTSGDGVLISAPSPSDVVVLRGLHIRWEGAGDDSLSDGIEFNIGNTLYVEHCVISGFPGRGINVEKNPYPQEILISDTTVRGNKKEGGFFDGFSIVYPNLYTMEVSIDRSRFEKNGGSGIHAQRNVKATVSGSVASNNDGTGMVVSNTGGVLNVESYVVSNNGGTGIFSGTGVTALTRVSNSTVANNKGYGFNGFGKIESRGNNLVRGNTKGDTFSGTPIIIVSGN